MDALTAANLLVYGIQTAVVAAAAGVIVWLLRIDSPAVRYACWRGVLVFCLLLPWLQGRAPVIPEPGVVFEATATAPVDDAKVAAADPLARSPGGTRRGGIPWLALLGMVLLGGVVARAGWLMVALARLRRLRTAGEPAPAGGWHDECQSAMQVRAEIRYVSGLGQPVTFGVRHPVILLPERLREQPVRTQQAVLCHELCHVRRRDWLWLLAEELVRAALWFNPAIWWIVNCIQRVREEVVDGLTVRVTRDRRGYAEALLACADARGTSAAAAFSPRHLYRRIVLISKERSMSLRRTVVAYAATVVVVGGCGWYAATLFPLVQTPSAQAQELMTEPGPLERAARPVTPENPVPRRTVIVPAHHPPEAAGREVRAVVTLRAVIGADGGVAEISTPRVMVRPVDGATERTALEEAFTRSAVTALRAWRYEPPAAPPIAIDVTFVFAPGEVEATATPSTPGISAGRVPDSAPPARVIGSGVRPPTVARHVGPAYSAEAMRARIEGSVLVEARVEPDGRVSHARVIRSLPLLDQQALEAVMQWQFTPGTEDGVPVPVLVTVDLSFTLRP